MGDKQKGWMIFIAMLGAFTTMIAVDVAQLQAWQTAWSPAFIGKLLGYFGTIIGSFVAGKLIPSSNDYHE